MTYDDYLEKAMGKTHRICYERMPGYEQWTSGELTRDYYGNIVLCDPKKGFISRIPYESIKWILPVSIQPKENKKELVIETDFHLGKNNIVLQHTSRIIQVEDWDSYCKTYKELQCETTCFTSKDIESYHILSNSKVSNLFIRYDRQLSCDITRYRKDGSVLYTTKRLACRVY